MIRPFTNEETKAQKRNVRDVTKVTQLRQSQNSESGHMGSTQLRKRGQALWGNCLNLSKSHKDEGKPTIQPYRVKG